MNVKNVLTAILAMLEAANAGLNFVPWHGVFGSLALIVRAIVDAFFPNQSNVPSN
jgi:hypothetical protein